MAARKTKDQLIAILVKRIKTDFNNIQAEAARAWGEERTIVSDVICGHRSPTKKILKALGYEKDAVHYVKESG